MTEYEMKQAVLAHLLAADFLNENQVDVPNSQGFKPSDDVWVRVSFSGASGVFAGFGSKPCTHRTGLVMLQCFTRATEYTQPIEEMAQKLVERLEWYFSDGFELQAADVIDVGVTENGAYYQKNINIPFLIKSIAA
ncbi:hypothetical protein EGK75_09120 [Neisseria weixii]|uniref:Uncharacterized protein n=1 Tax=Neisseria weixii TaxID=1853276 RepID=A0A3N4N253_9NEIS|nr:phage tail terminator-like protein [Neisseria weixii]RPD86272.1 hypothetical protein EGK75_09120 [Neisseria weixii]RPD89408.1 hypothetical protein EGK74_04095 [Neisseria weixii]